MANNDKNKINDALLKKAMGYDYEEKIVEVSKDGKTQSIKLVRKHVPPDLKAINEIRYLISIGRWEDRDK